MNKWSVRRKRIIFSIVFIFLLVLVGLPLFFIFYRAPTCSDGKQNGDEKGVDCGGSCQLLCPVESLPIIGKGDPRILRLASSTYEVVAIFDNPNVSAEIDRAQYVIKLYSLGNPVPIKTIEDFTFVPSNKTFAIFEGPFVIEDVVPDKAVLEWQKESLNWRKNSNPHPSITLKDEAISKEDSTPRLNATIVNQSLNEVKNIELIALVLNEEGNIFAASKTFVDVLPSGASAPIVFSWPRPFENKAAGADIIIRILPDKSFIR